MNSDCGSVQRTSRNRELRMVQKTLEICLSETHASGRSTDKRSFNPSNDDSRCEGDNGKGMNGGHKEGRQKQKVRKVHFAALMDIRHIQKYKDIPGMSARAISSVDMSTSTSRWMFARAISSVEIIKPRWISGTRISREDRWSRNKGRHF